MKNKIFTLMSILTTLSMYSQSTFTFSGNGNWIDTAQWENGNYPGTTINIGDSVVITGELTISQATTVTNNGTIESLNTATSTPTITILGDLLNNKDITLNRTQVTVGAGGSIITNGTSTLEVTNNSNLTSLGSISVIGGTVRLSSTVSSIINNNSFTNSGTVEVLAGTFENKAETIVGMITFDNNGQFTVANTGRLINRGNFNNNTSGILTNSRSVTNEVTGSIENLGLITITGFSNSLVNNGSFNNLKTINVEDNARFNVSSGSIFTNQGDGNLVIFVNSRVLNSSNMFEINGGKLINNGTFENTNETTIGIDGEIVNNGTISGSFFGGGEINNSGVLSGTNISHSADFTNAGILSPGNSNDATGIYNLDGFLTSYTQTNSGSLKIELGGTLAGNTYDQVVIDDDATLDGTLNVLLVDGFEPNVGDTFSILEQGGNISGTFSTVNLPTLPLGKIWNPVEYNASGVVISVIADVLSIRDFENESLKSSKMTLYPNPVEEGEVFVTGISDLTDVTIFNLHGQEIIKTKVSNKNSSVKLNNLDIGTYFLKVKNTTFKFFKM